MWIDTQKLGCNERELFYILRVYDDDKSYRKLDRPNTVMTVVIDDGGGQHQFGKSTAHIYALFGMFTREVYKLIKEELKKLGVIDVYYERPGGRMKHAKT